MKGVMRGVLRFLAYTGWFVVAFGFFFYLTLPLDAVADLLVRKAADEYDYNLAITELDTWGVGGLQARGVTLTRKPTPDELAEIDAAQQLRREWADAQKAKAAAKPDTKGGDTSAGQDTEPKIPPGAEDMAAALEKMKPGPKGTAEDTESTKAEDEPPPVPSGPQPLYVEELRISTDLLELLRGKERGELEAALLGGTVNARVERNAEAFRLRADLGALDLRQIPFLRALLPMPVIGLFDGNIDVEVPRNGEDGALRLGTTGGTAKLKLTRAALGPGQIKLDAKRTAFEYFDLPKISIDEMSGEITFEKRRANIDRFDVTGKDVEAELTGYIQMANQLKRWAPNLHIRFKFKDDFLEKNTAVKVAMKNIPDIKRGTEDGHTGFAMRGTFTKPRFTPMKSSPHKTRSRRRARDTNAGNTKTPAKRSDARADKRDKAGGSKRSKRSTRATPSRPNQPAPDDFKMAPDPDTKKRIADFERRRDEMGKGIADRQPLGLDPSAIEARPSPLPRAVLNRAADLDEEEGDEGDEGDDEVADPEHDDEEDEDEPSDDEGEPDDAIDDEPHDGDDPPDDEEPLD